jgi:hypothetical protein
MGMYAVEESDGCIVPKKPRTMPSNSAGIGLLLKQLVHGSEQNGYPIPRRPITFDLRQEPGAGKPHARICTGGEE